MALDLQWKHKYKILKNYISSNPEISISTYEVSIPAHLRDDFFMKFDDVRRALVESWSSLFDFDIYALGENFIEAESSLAECLNLKHMHLPVDLASILYNPKEGMMRLIYDRLFEILQKKITEDDFEKMAESDLITKTSDMFRLGYEPWAAVSILLLLEPDEILNVSLNEDAHLYTSELDQIVLGRQSHHPAKRIPEFIIHSKKLASYIAFKMPLLREVDSYYLPVEVPTQRVLRDRTGDTSAIMDYRMLFLTVVQDLKKLPVFADMHERTINGPDLSIEFLMENDLSDSEVIGRIQNRVEILKPRLEGNIVIMDQGSISGSFKIKENLNTFSVGLDQSGLQPIIDKLAN